MTSRNRSNPLALAVLICLAERPMHPYEIATTLRQRNKHESVRLNYGSLYSVVESLEKRALVVPGDIERSGRLPERTIYQVTDAGLVEMHDWLADLVSTPSKDYPGFEAALSFLPAIDPEEILGLLDERAHRLEFEIAGASASRKLIEKQRLPRLFWVEAEFRMALRRTELEFVLRLISDIRSGRLDGLEWWREVHQGRHVPPNLDSFDYRVSDSNEGEEHQ
jgi:DNA-binding PadR family transcriptional regulator